MNKKKNLDFFDSPIGRLRLIEEGGYIVNIDWCKDKFDISRYTLHESEEVVKAKSQLEEYFNGKRQVFDLKFRQEGTEFRKKVWNALLNIKYGETCSYKDIAQVINNPLACRAVGQANNKNNLAIIVPCHRVIGWNKAYVGYAGGLEVKKYLLNLEKDNK